MCEYNIPTYKLRLDENEDVPEGYKAESQLCVGSPDHKDICNGDSGGPLLVPHSGDGCQYQVMGITSVGIACGTPNIPSLYTRMYFFRDWVKRAMNQRVILFFKFLFAPCVSAKCDFIFVLQL